MAVERERGRLTPAFCSASRSCWITACSIGCAARRKLAVVPGIAGGRYSQLVDLPVGIEHRLINLHRAIRRDLPAPRAQCPGRGRPVSVVAARRPARMRPDQVPGSRVCVGRPIGFALPNCNSRHHSCARRVRRGVAPSGSSRARRSGCDHQSQQRRYVAFDVDHRSPLVNGNMITPALPAAPLPPSEPVYRNLR